MTANDCSLILRNFLEEAPLTQREWLAARAHFIVFDGGESPDINHLEDLVNVLTNGDHFDRSNWVVKIAAALDHALLDHGPSQKSILEDVVKKIATDGEEPDSQLKTMLAQAELRERHLRSIRSQWTQLRSTSLRPLAVRDFEQSMLNPD